ncbi:hypothetical protein HII36_28745 [Nonomuraea sp. NN258]|uniref:WGxxGxxG family protein n=1 Tax=Nonomuraea antri TaxID=2730852 RepID=UPI001568F0AD|nr:WGxxGxxG family protein [Nonomuraea antri]NRQ35793.1 hypothetical protein [Nonomuraea antri]
MGKTLTGLGLAFFLTLAPTSAAVADTQVAPITQSQATPSPQPTDTNRDEGGGGNGGLWGLLGLLGLLGLAGMRKRRDVVGTAEHIPNRGTGTGTRGTGPTNRP